MKTITFIFLAFIISSSIAQQKDILYINLRSEIPDTSIDREILNQKFTGTPVIDSNLNKLFDSIVFEVHPDKPNWIAFNFQGICTIISYEKTTQNNKDSCEILISPYMTKVELSLYKQNYLIKNGVIRFNRKKGIIYYDNVKIILDDFKKT